MFLISIYMYVYLHVYIYSSCLRFCDGDFKLCHTRLELSADRCESYYIPIHIPMYRSVYMYMYRCICTCLAWVSETAILNWATRDSNSAPTDASLTIYLYTYLCIDLYTCICIGVYVHLLPVFPRRRFWTGRHATRIQRRPMRAWLYTYTHTYV